MAEPVCARCGQGRYAEIHGFSPYPGDEDKCHPFEPSPTEELEESVRRYVLTHYWSDGHTPYRNVLRDPETDKPAAQSTFLDEPFAELGADDGDEIEIVVRKTGRRPFSDRKVRLVKAHTYERDKETP